MDLYGNIFHVATVECDFEFAEVIEQEKKELWRRLLDVYFKDEVTIYEILKDEEKWEEYFAELLQDEDAKELFEEHFYRQLTHRYAGTLYCKTTVRPEKIVRQIALFVGTYYITQYVKSETSLSPENKLKCANIMLKIEIRSLGKDLERREDLCDDLLNEIYRHERKIDIKAVENDELILKNKSRHAKINILREELRKLGNPPDMEKQRPSTTAKSGKSKDKDKNKDKDKDKDKGKDKVEDKGEDQDRDKDSDIDGDKDRHKDRDKDRDESEDQDKGSDKDKDQNKKKKSDKEKEKAVKFEKEKAIKLEKKAIKRDTSCSSETSDSD